MDCQKIAEEVYGLAKSDHLLAPLVEEALSVIDECLDTHGLGGASLSFNGGKDCTVLLHLYAGALARRTPPGQEMIPIKALYIPVSSPFSDLERFIDEAVKAYNIDLYVSRPPSSKVGSIPTPTSSPLIASPSIGSSYVPQPRASGNSKGAEGMRQALEIYKDAFPQITAILIGTRRTDPHGGKLSHRNMTDPGWPRFERVNPIIDWSYGDVWAFLCHLHIPYCSLYDQGYTSLGSTYNTFPNPALLIRDSDADSFLPETETPVSASSLVTPTRTLQEVMSNTHTTPMCDDESLSPASTLSPCMSTTHAIPNGSSRYTGAPGILGSMGIEYDLKSLNGPCTCRYLPAYELKDGSLERCGRGSAQAFQAAHITRSSA